MYYLPDSDFRREIFSRSAKTTISDVETLIPDDTDALLLFLTDCWQKTLSLNMSPTRDLSHLYYTVQCIHKKEIDWQKLFVCAVKFDVIHQIRFVLEMLDDFFPELLPKNLADTIPSNPDEDLKKAQREILSRNRFLRKIIERKFIQKQLIISQIFKFYVFYQQTKNVLRHRRKSRNHH
jgi:hypothetical protein